MDKIPVTIITGFLGAGKTTLLNNLVRKHPEKKFAVIENEFGEIGIDGELIVGVKDNIFELSNGCICCSLNAGFIDTIKQLLNSPYPFNHLLVETTGIADPSAIVKAFMDFSDRFRIDGVLCLADAVNMEDTMVSEVEVRKQIALSDIVLLNKTECVSPEVVETLREVIHGINPMVAVYPVSYAGINDIEVLDIFAYTDKCIEKSTLSFSNLSMLQTENMASSLLQVTQNVSHNIRAIGVSVPGSIRLSRFNFWINSVLFLNKDSIYRVKGILSVADDPRRQIFHAVRDSVTCEPGSSWGDAPRFCKLVLIGKNIDRDKMEQHLHQMLAKE